MSTSRPSDAHFASRGALASALTQRLNERTRLSLPASAMGLRESAVLVPILWHGDAPPEVLYIVRRADAPTHSGQVAFPGGKREAHDPSITDTALRESFEEVGLSPEDVTLCGLLDDVPTPAGFSITPVVGIVGLGRHAPISFQPSQREVAELFCVPIPAFSSSYHLAGHTRWQGIRYALHEFHYADPAIATTRRIWGATARMTYQLLSLLDLVPPLSDHD
ncbi:MAG: CoA pyrophosphatase [Myxococcales bacterium]|nr:CoA pyrophosphatase [Myxococcales bacterium]